MICLLCLRRPAEQTGSHITSAFLLASQIGKRGEEKAFLITTEPEQDYSENQGDKGIKEDNIFCRDCERRLSFIEGYYSTEITQKIEEERFNQNFQTVKTKHGNLVRCLRIDPIAFSLLIYSNIWRAALSNRQLYAHFTLPEVVMEEIRFLLDLFLPETVDHKVTISLNVWLNSVKDCISFFKFFPYIILKAEKLENKTITYQFFDNLTNQPNHIIINEYVILPFFADTKWEDDFFKFKDEVSYDDLINYRYEEAKIGIISNARYMQIMQQFQDLAVERRILNIDMQCSRELLLRSIPITWENIIKCRMEKIAQIKPDKGI